MNFIRLNLAPWFLLVGASGVLMATARAADEFELVDSTFSPVAVAAGGEFSVALQPVESVSISEPLTGGEFSSDPLELVLPPVEESALPALALQLGIDGVVQLSWGIEAAGAALESSENLVAWRVEVPALDGAGTRAVVPSAGVRFFRLRR